MSGKRKVAREAIMTDGKAGPVLERLGPLVRFPGSNVLACQVVHPSPGPGAALPFRAPLNPNPLSVIFPHSPLLHPFYSHLTSFSFFLASIQCNIFSVPFRFHLFLIIINTHGFIFLTHRSFTWTDDSLGQLLKLLEWVRWPGPLPKILMCKLVKLKFVSFYRKILNVSKTWNGLRLFYQ